MSSLESVNGPLAPCSSGAIRAIVTFGDDVQQAIQQWPSAYRDKEACETWARTVAAATPRSTFDIQVWCVGCGAWEWASEGICSGCGWARCAKYMKLVDEAAARDGFEDRDLLCDECDENRREDAKAFDDDTDWRDVPRYGEL